MSSDGYHEVHIFDRPSFTFRMMVAHIIMPDLRLNRTCDPVGLPEGSLCYEYPTGRESEFEKRAFWLGLRYQWGGGASGRYQVYRIGQDNVPVKVGDITTTDILTKIIVAGRYAFGISANVTNNLTIIDHGEPDNPVQIVVFNTGDITTDLSVQGRYIYITSATVMRILDVSVPDTPVIIGSAL